MTIQATAGPAVIAFLVAGDNPWAALGWLALAVMFVAGALTISPAVRRAHREEEEVTTAA